MGQLTMPKLGDTMEEGTVVRWLKKPGDTVREGEVIAEIETEKSVMEMTAFESGVLTEILLPEGQTVPVGTPIAYLRTEGEAETAPAAEPPSARKPEQTKTAEPAPPPKPAEAEHPVGERLKASPLARRLAQAEGVDLSQLRGTGPGGRILGADVKEFLAARGRTERAAPPTEPSAVAEKPEQLVQPSRMRRTIARRMVQSKQTVPHFYVTVEVDMKAAAELRTSLNALEGERPKITFTDMVVKAAAIALTKVPQAGTQYQEEGLKPPSGMHIGIAVALDDGLVVPVLRDADKKTLLSIARETKELAERARQGKLKPDEYSGGVLSISNLGMFDVESFSAIINPPEAAILAVGSILEVPAVVNGEITIRPRMKVTMSADHRVLDGVVAAKFLQEFKRALEQPLSLLE